MIEAQTIISSIKGKTVPRTGLLVGLRTKLFGEKYVSPKVNKQRVLDVAQKTGVRVLAYHLTSLRLMDGKKRTEERNKLLITATVKYTGSLHNFGEELRKIGYKFDEGLRTKARGTAA